MGAVDLPFARFLGITWFKDGSDCCAKLPFRPMLIGNPLLPALHGGVTAALLQITAQATLVQCGLGVGEQPPKLIDFTVDYLRRGQPEYSYAKASITRAGRRFASVSVTMWQADPDTPIAAAHGHFALGASS